MGSFAAVGAFGDDVPMLNSGKVYAYRTQASLIAPFVAAGVLAGSLLNCGDSTAPPQDPTRPTAGEVASTASPPRLVVTYGDDVLPVVRVDQIPREETAQRWLVEPLWGESAVGVIGWF